MAFAEGGDIHGNGVKLAAPLDRRVEAGGVRVARTLFEHIENTAGLGFQGPGKLAIKNIAEPLRVYRVLIEPRPQHEIVGHEVPRTPLCRRQDEKSITITLRLWLFSLIRRTETFGTGSLADPENECKPYGEAGMGEPTKAKRTKLKATLSEESESLEAAGPSCRTNIDA